VRPPPKPGLSTVLITFADTKTDRQNLAVHVCIGEQADWQTTNSRRIG